MALFARLSGPGAWETRVRPPSVMYGDFRVAQNPSHAVGCPMKHGNVRDFSSLTIVDAT